MNIYETIYDYCIHTEKLFLNFIKSTRNQIVFTMHRLICLQTDVRLDPNQSGNGKYNMISGIFNKIWKWFLCVYHTRKTTPIRRTAVRETLASIGIMGGPIDAPLVHNNTIILRVLRRVPHYAETLVPRAPDVIFSSLVASYICLYICMLHIYIYVSYIYVYGTA